MTKYVAFLRGINVGGRIIKMADLKACFENMDLHNVTTVLQTGNVVFEADESDLSALRQKVETAVSVIFHYPAKILVYPTSEVQKMAAAYPYDSSDDSFQHYLIFLEEGEADKLAAAATALGLDKSVEEIQSGKNVLYWKVKKGMTTKSQFAKHLAKYTQPNTARNLKTVNKVINL